MAVSYGVTFRYFFFCKTYPNFVKVFSSLAIIYTEPVCRSLLLDNRTLDIAWDTKERWAEQPKPGAPPLGPLKQIIGKEHLNTFFPQDFHF